MHLCVRVVVFVSVLVTSILVAVLAWMAAAEYKICLCMHVYYIDFLVPRLPSWEAWERG